MVGTRCGIIPIYREARTNRPNLNRYDSDKTNNETELPMRLLAVIHKQKKYK